MHGTRSSATSSSKSSFDPLILADGKTDLFVVAPEETIEHVEGWLRLWVAIPNAVAGINGNSPSSASTASACVTTP